MTWSPSSGTESTREAVGHGAIGNHMKMQLPDHLRPQARTFYGEVLGCRALDSPLADLDLFEFEGGFVLGIFFGDDALALSSATTPWHSRRTTISAAPGSSSRLRIPTRSSAACSSSGLPRSTMPTPRASTFRRPAARCSASRRWMAGYEDPTGASRRCRK